METSESESRIIRCVKVREPKQELPGVDVLIGRVQVSCDLTPLRRARLQVGVRELNAV